MLAEGRAVLVHDGGVVRELAAAPLDVGEQLVALAHGPVEQGREGLRLGPVPAPAQGLHDGGQRRDLQVLDDPGRVLGAAEPRERLELGQRQHGLRLGPVVLVVAGRVAQRDRRRVLPGPSLLRLGAVRVHLDRQGLLDGEDLEQEGQATVEPARAPGAELPLGVR